MIAIRYFQPHYFSNALCIDDIEAFATINSSVFVLKNILQLLRFLTYEHH